MHSKHLQLWLWKGGKTSQKWRTLIPGNMNSTSCLLVCISLCCSYELRIDLALAPFHWTNPTPPPKKQFTLRLLSLSESASDKIVLNSSRGNFKVKMCLERRSLRNIHFSKGFIIWLQGHRTRIGVRAEANTKTMKRQPQGHMQTHGCTKTVT